MFGRQLLINLTTLIAVSLLVLSGCSEDDTYHKIPGNWEGEITNSSTGQDWAFTIYFDHRGSDLSGYYSDYRGDLTIRNITYDGENIGFVIDIWPEAVTFFGTVISEASMSGTWSYSGDQNNGIWYLLKDQDPEEDDEEGENTEDTGAQRNPFAKN